MDTVKTITLYDALTNITTVVEITDEETANQVAPSGDEQDASTLDSPSDPERQP